MNFTFDTTVPFWVLIAPFVALGLLFASTIFIFEMGRRKRLLELIAGVIVLIASIIALSLTTEEASAKEKEAAAEVKAEIQRVYGGNVLEDELDQIVESVSRAEKTETFLVQDDITVFVNENLISANLIYVDGEYRFYANEGELQEQSAELPRL